MAIRVLILEENPGARSFLCRVVRESFSDTMSITEAGSVDAARQALSHAVGGSSVSADPFKLVLIDLELTDGNGMALLAALADYPAIKTVTTLHSDDDHLFPALKCGADGYLLKEDRFEGLVEELQKIVRGQPPLSPAIARRLLTHFRHQVSSSYEARRNAQDETSQNAAFRRAPPVPIRDGGLPNPEPLTPRESEVLTNLSKGVTIKEIAGQMSIKWITVNDHVKSIYKKLDATSRAETAVLAAKHHAT